MPARLSPQWPYLRSSYVFGKDQLHSFSLKQSHLLEDEVELRLLEDAHQFGLTDGRQADFNGKPSEQLGNKVFHLRHRKRSTGYEENMVGLDVAVFGVDSGAFY
jgi:hypothetical protein